MKLVCIVGATAAGKSELAAAIAHRLGGEIVNADSMQVFRHLAIGTGVPPPSVMERAPHHLFQYVDPDVELDAGRWSRDAAGTIGTIRSRGGVPFVVGGTFFWMRALLEGLSGIPSVPAHVKKRLAGELARFGLGTMYKRLSSVDRRTASRLAPNDRQRIMRALEVFEATGTPLSRFLETPRRPVLPARVFRIEVVLPRDTLYRNIDSRVERMVNDGLVQEVGDVLDMGFPQDVRPLRSGSYRPVVEYLRGVTDIATMKAEIARSHRNYAKRQLTWLRREAVDLRVPPDGLEEATRAVGDFLASPTSP